MDLQAMSSLKLAETHFFLSSKQVKLIDQCKLCRFHLKKIKHFCCSHMTHSKTSAKDICDTLMLIYDQQQQQDM